MIDDTSLSILIETAHGNRFVYIVPHGQWTPLDLRDIGAQFAPNRLLEVIIGQRRLYTAPIAEDK